MQETIERILNYLHGIWRFRWTAIITAWIIAPIGWAVVAVLPNTYEANAQVYVDTDSILKPLLRGLAVESVDITERLGMMSIALLSRPNLEKMIRDADLDVNLTTAGQKEALIADLLKNIQIRGTRTHRTPRPEPHNLYIISVRNSNPETAYKIVNSLLNIFLEDTLGGTREGTDVAQRFLDQQIKEYEAKLAAAEKRLNDFKRVNVDSLPEQGSSYYQRLQATQNSLDEIELELHEARNRKDELTRQLQGVSPTQRFIAADGTHIMSPIEQRITILQKNLDELRLKYTDQHPDVIETRTALEQLQRERDEQEKSGLNASDNQAQNPMYQQIKLALGEVEANIAALRVRYNEYKDRMERLKTQIEVLPQVEAELTALNRDYEINKNNYDTLITRKSSAKISEQAEQTGEDVKLKVIDPPRVPATPVAPNRLVLSAVVIFMAYALGMGLAFLLSQVKPAFYTQKMLRQAIDMPILGSVSMMSLPTTIYRRKLQLIAFFVASGVLFIAFIVVIYLHVSGMLAGFAM